MSEIRSLSVMVLVAVALAAACAQDDRLSVPTAPKIESPAGERLPLFGLGDLRRAYPGTPCASGPHRQFDFWVGDWDVAAFSDPATRLGWNRILMKMDGCLIEENWTGAGGGPGRSLNTYDRATGQWHQHWIDAFGTHIILSGGLVDENMVMRGPRPARFDPGIILVDEITWVPLDPDVRQIFDIFVGGTLVFRFDGLYQPTANFDPVAPGSFGVCSAAPYDQLDFWVGDWNVSGENGLPLAVSEVVEDLDNCLIQENLITPKGYRAESFSGYDVARERWAMTLVDSEATRLFLTGGIQGDAMVLTGDRPEGGRLRLTLEPLGDGRVRQTWERNRGGSGTWKSELVVIYEPA